MASEQLTREGLAFTLIDAISKTENRPFVSADRSYVLDLVRDVMRAIDGRKGVSGRAIDNLAPSTAGTSFSNAGGTTPADARVDPDVSAAPDVKGRRKRGRWAS